MLTVASLFYSLSSPSFGADYAAPPTQSLSATESITGGSEMQKVADKLQGTSKERLPGCVKLGKQVLFLLQAGERNFFTPYSRN